jgi:hypothetical protein
MGKPREILMLREYTGPLGSYRDGKVYTVVREVALALIACGAADDLSPRPVRRAQEEEEA